MLHLDRHFARPTVCTAVEDSSRRHVPPVTTFQQKSEPISMPISFVGGFPGRCKVHRLRLMLLKAVEDVDIEREADDAAQLGRIQCFQDDVRSVVVSLKG